MDGKRSHNSEKRDAVPYPWRYGATSMAKINEQLQRDYEDFIVEIPMMMEDLAELLRNSHGYQGVAVGFDGDTLEAIESFVRDVHRGVEKVSCSLARLNRIYLAYAGEAVIERADGEWVLNDEPNDPSFGMPCVIWHDDEVWFSPRVARTTALTGIGMPLRRRIAFVSDPDGFMEEINRGL